MKVWQLIANLSEAPAMAEVAVSNEDESTAVVESCMEGRDCGTADDTFYLYAAAPKPVE